MCDLALQGEVGFGCRKLGDHASKVVDLAHVSGVDCVEVAHRHKEVVKTLSREHDCQKAVRRLLKLIHAPNRGGGSFALCGNIAFELRGARLVLGNLLFEQAQRLFGFLVVFGGLLNFGYEVVYVGLKLLDLGGLGCIRGMGCKEPDHRDGNCKRDNKNSLLGCAIAHDTPP